MVTGSSQSRQGFGRDNESATRPMQSLSSSLDFQVISLKSSKRL